MYPRTLVLFIILVVAPASAWPEQQSVRLHAITATVHGGLKVAVPQTQENTPRIGLALAGGGARAAASIGVLKVLLREKIPVAAIAGTSMGAGVGGLFAAGYSPDEIEAIFLENDWNDIFSDTPGRAFQTQEQKEAASRHLLEFTFYRGAFMPPAGLSAGQKLTNLLASKTLAASFEAKLDFDRLRVPFRAVATDIETGDTVVIGRGLLHEAMRASAAIPMVFQPVEYQGRLLVDGGMANNLPVDVVRSMGADIVIAVDASTRLEKKEQLTSLIEVMNQATSLQMRLETARQAAHADVVITPDTTRFGFTDFPDMDAIIRQGESAAETALPRIRELIRRKQAAREGTDRYRLTDIVITGARERSEAAVRHALAVVHVPCDVTGEELLARVTDVFRTGLFSAVTLDLEPEGSGSRAVVTVKENPVVRVIRVTGNTIITDDEVNEALAWQRGEILNSSRLAASLDELVAVCRGKGFLLTRIERTLLDPETGVLTIGVSEGRVDSITLTGQRRTQRSLIQRETRTRVGAPLNLTTAADDIQHLYALDYFQSLSADMAESPRGGVDITLRIREKPTTRVRLGLRYDLDDRFTGLTDLVEENALGQGIRAYLFTRYGNYTDLAAGYRSPMFLDTYFVHGLQALYRSRRYSLYQDRNRINELDITRTGAELTFGYQWFRFGDTFLRYRYVTDRAEESLGADPARTDLHISSIALLSTVDTRDRESFAEEGFLFKGSYETAATNRPADSGFTKTSVYVQGVIPLAERHAFVLEGSAGIGSGDLPYQEKFGVGGADYLLGFPLAGFERRELVGSEHLGFSAAYRWKMREYQLKAVRAVYLNVAAQAANVWDRSSDISMTGLKNGASAGLHMDTIIGPVRLDVGAGSQDRRMIYFSAGYDF